MIAAGVVTLLFHRLRQPVVLGYILAGVIIGPHTPPFPLIHDRVSIETLAELGVIFLMFSLGLDFSLRTLKRVGSTAFIGAIVEIVAMIWVGYEVGQFFGWGRMNSLFLGAILSISSTTITVKVLTELGRLKEEFAQLSLAILIVEDILAIALIALLSGVAMTGSVQAIVVAKMLGRIGVFLIVVLVTGLIAVPLLLGYVGRYRSNEMLLVTVLGLCFGVSLVTVKLGYSVALGAFVIGTIIGETREIGKVKLLTEPVRDVFSAVFFVSIGMLIDPALLGRYAVPILVITVAVVIGKVLSRTVGVFVAGHDTRTSLRVGMTLAQIGEFSFIIAALGVSLKVTSDFIYPIAVSVSVLTTLLTPYLVRSSDAVVEKFDHIAPRALVSWLELYSQWLERFRGKGREHGSATAGAQMGVADDAERGVEFRRVHGSGIGCEPGGALVAKRAERARRREGRGVVVRRAGGVAGIDCGGAQAAGVWDVAGGGERDTGGGGGQNSGDSHDYLQRNFCDRRVWAGHVDCVVEFSIVAEGNGADRAAADRIRGDHYPVACIHSSSCQGAGGGARYARGNAAAAARRNKGAGAGYLARGATGDGCSVAGIAGDRQIDPGNRTAHENRRDDCGHRTSWHSHRQSKSRRRDSGQRQAAVDWQPGTTCRRAQVANRGLTPLRLRSVGFAETCRRA